jgi:cholest-4-en-3-one 26-monooxygenase
MDHEKLDLYDPSVYERAVPHDLFRRLRTEQPVYWHAREREGGPGYWAITRHEDLIRISRDPATFSSARGGTNIEDYPAEDLSVIQLIMLNMDPPQHIKFRKLVRDGFAPRMIARMEPHIREICKSVVDKIAGKGECDFVLSLAAELPLQVIAEMLGVPIADRGKLFDWSNRLIGFDDPEFQTSLEDGKVAAMEMWMYANDLAAKRTEQGEDLVSVLMRAEVDGERLTEMEFDSFFLLLSVAGNETTRNLLSGGMLALLEHPAELARLKADPSLLHTAVEEMLRWVSPVMYFRRTATRDVELRGKLIKEGQKVVMYYPAANRDEAVFANADKFDVGRTPNEHLAFGVGEHFCLGSTLARLEIKLFFEEVLSRLDEIQLAGPVRRLRSNFINGIKQMPVRFAPERT